MKCSLNVKLNVYVLLLFLIRIQSIELNTSESFNIENPDYISVISDYDHDYILPNDVTLNITINKCQCKFHQIWNGSVCTDSGTDVSVYYNSLNQYFQYTRNLAQNFHLGTFSCEEDSFKIRSKIGDSKIFISEFGDIYYQEADLVQTSSNFCVELHEDKADVEIEAVLCVPHFQIPACRPFIGDFVYPVTVGSYVVPAKTEHLVNVDKKQCSSKDLEKKIILSTDNKNVKLHYRSGVTSLVWTPNNYYSKTEVFLPVDYCISLENDSVYVVNTCYEDILAKHRRECETSVCIRKCCGFDQSYDLIDRTCSNQKDRENYSAITNFSRMATKLATQVTKNLKTEINFPWCSNGSYLLDKQTDDFYLLENGSLHINLSNLTMSPSEYCIDDFLEGNLSSVKAITCFLKLDEKSDLCKVIHDILYPILLLVSCIFLCITLIVYASIQELHAKLHGKSLISHVSSLLGAFVCQFIISWNASNLSMIVCKLVGLVNQVTFLWAFFWLNVMCFDIWWTLKTMSPRPETGENTRRRFIYYSIYAWGTPAIIVMITAVMEFLPSSVDKTDLILPGFGVRGCWFQNTTSTWVYFHGFTLLLYVTNILFFFHVAAILIKEQRSIEGILRTTWKQHKERIWLYLKLFVVMGITWICEVASWQEGTCEYWMFTDIINSLQGVFIFFIFMCNRKVFQKIQTKGMPFLKTLKRFFKYPSRRVVATGSTSSRRTTQTSVESSSRRLSTSVQPPEHAFNKKSTRSKEEKKQTET